MYNTKNYAAQGGDEWVIGGKLTVAEDATIEGLAADPLTVATADTLGGVKVGDGLTITDGVLAVANPLTAADNQAESEAEELAELVTDFNALLTKLKDAGLMTADEE